MFLSKFGKVVAGFVCDCTFSLKLLFFLVVLFQERCFPSVSVTSNSNFSFKIVWPASVKMYILEDFLLNESLRQ